MASPSQTEASGPQDKALSAWIIAAMAGTAAVWLGWKLGWPWVIDLQSPEFNPMVVLEGVLLLVTLWFVVQALLWGRRASRFGTSLVDIDGKTPVPLGSTFSGRVRTDRPIPAKSDFRLTLTCYDVHERREDGDANRTEAYSTWTSDTTLPAMTDSANGLPFRFILPASVGEKPVAGIRQTKSKGAFVSGSVSVSLPGFRRIYTHNQPPVSRYWKLTVTAPTDGPDYLAEFVVPIADH